MKTPTVTTLWLGLVLSGAPAVGRAAAGPAAPRQIVAVPNTRSMIVIDQNQRGDVEQVLRFDESKRRFSVISSAQRGEGPPLRNTSSPVLSADGETLYLCRAGSILAVDLASGARRVLSGEDLNDKGGPAPKKSGRPAIIGTGPRLAGACPIVFDAPRKRLIALNARGQSLLAVDLDNGNRTRIESDLEKIRTSRCSCKAAAMAQDGALLVSACKDSLHRIDLGTGRATLVSDKSRGAGKPLRRLTAIVQPTKDRIFALDNRSIVSIDVGSGDRSALAPATKAGRGRRVRTFATHGLTFDAVSGRLFGVETNQGILYEVDTKTGEQKPLWTRR